jgi:hypothetical protein
VALKISPGGGCMPAAGGDFLLGAGRGDVLDAQQNGGSGDDHRCAVGFVRRCGRCTKNLLKSADFMRFLLIFPQKSYGQKYGSA